MESDLLKKIEKSSGVEKNAILGIASVILSLNRKIEEEALIQFLSKTQ